MLVGLVDEVVEAIACDSCGVQNDIAGEYQHVEVEGISAGLNFYF